MATRVIVLAVALVLLAGALVWLVEASGDTSAAELTGPAPTDTAPPPARDEVAGGEVARRPEALAFDEASPASPAADEPPRAAAPAEGAALALRGRVVLETVDGDELHDVDGTLTFTLRTDDAWRRTRVPLAEGAFALALKPVVGGYRDEHGTVFDAAVADATLAVAEAQLAGREFSAVPVDPSAPFAFGDEDARVRLRELPPLRLHVHDEATGDGLRDVTLIAKPESLYDGMLHPGPGAGAQRPLARGASPLVVRPTAAQARRQTLHGFVHAEGFAWAPVQLDVAAGGERRVGLARGGALDVRFARPVEVQGAALRLRPPQDPWRPVLDTPVVGVDELALEVLLPGAYDLQVEVGRFWDEPVVLASRAVEVVAGARRSVHVVLDEAPGLVRAPLSGRLVLPEAWGEPSSLSIELLDTPLDGSEGRHTQHRDDLRPLAPGVYAWDAGLVQTGRYEINARSVEYGQVFEVGPAGRDDVVLEVPPPVEVTLRVDDAHTGRPAELDSLHWHCERPEGVRGGGLESATREVGSEVYRLRVPDGVTVVVTAHGFEYTPLQERFVASAGLELTYTVEPAAVVVVRLLDGDTPVPWPHDDYGVGEAVGHAGRLNVRGRREGALRFNVTEPGRYRLRIPPVAGFEPHGPVVVDAVAGETREVEVGLTRRP